MRLNVEAAHTETGTMRLGAAAAKQARDVHPETLPSALCVLRKSPNPPGDGAVATGSHNNDARWRVVVARACASVDWKSDRHRSHELKYCHIRSGGDGKKGNPNSSKRRSVCASYITVSVCLSVCRCLYQSVSLSIYICLHECLSLPIFPLYKIGWCTV